MNSDISEVMKPFRQGLNLIDERILIYQGSTGHRRSLSGCPFHVGLYGHGILSQGHGIIIAS